MPHAYSEDQLVEQPAIELFDGLGWPTVSAVSEVLGADGTLIFKHSGRMKEAEMEAFFATLGELVGVNLGAEKQP